MWNQFIFRPHMCLTCRYVEHVSVHNFSFFSPFFEIHLFSIKVSVFLFHILKIRYCRLVFPVISPFEQLYFFNQKFTQRKHFISTYSRSSTLLFLCWCHQYVSSKEVKGQLVVYENSKQAEHRLSECNQAAKISPKSTGVNWETETTEIWKRRRFEDYSLCVENQGSKGRTVKTEEYRRRGRILPTETSSGGQDCVQTMDILETEAYDRRQRRNLVPENLLIVLQ